MLDQKCMVVGRRERLDEARQNKHEVEIVGKMESGMEVFSFFTGRRA